MRTPITLAALVLIALQSLPIRLRIPRPGRPRRRQKTGAAEIYPDSTRPGATNTNIKQSNIKSNICNKGWSRTRSAPHRRYEAHQA